MSNEIVTQDDRAVANASPEGLLPKMTFSRDQVNLIKATVARDTTDDEFALFLYVAKNTGLNPLLRQIHAVKRWDSKLEREAMAIQTGIDGYRLIAERTGKYAPGREPEFAHGEDGDLVSATAYVKKMTADGTWHEVPATAFYDEYVQTKKDGTPNIMWGKMPHSQLAKCAEALAIRKAFPSETAGVQGEEEMGQAENIIEGQTAKAPISEPQAKAAAPKPSGDSVSFVPKDVKVKSDVNKNGNPYTKYGIVAPSGETYGTFDKVAGELAMKAKTDQFHITVVFSKNGNFLNADSVTAPDNQGDAQE